MIVFSNDYIIKKYATKVHMMFERYIDSHKIILESTSITEQHEIDVNNPCYRLGFAHQLMNLAGYDPMHLSAVFAATQRISSSMGMLPWTICTYNEGTKIPDSFYADHLFDNCIQTKFMFMKNMIKDVIITGNAYALIERDETGKPKNLIYLMPGMCTVEYDSTHTHVYYRIPMLRQGLVEPVDVIHFFMDSADGIQGRALLDFANKSIRLAGYTEKASMSYFATGMRASGILTTNAPRLNDEQRKKIRDSYLAGTMAEGGIAVLEAGMTFSQMTNNARDSQLLDARQFNVQEIARYFNMLPQNIGDMTHLQYNTIEMTDLDFTSHTLGPWIEMAECELNRKLILPRDKSKYYINLDTDKLVKSDRNSYASYLSTLASKGFISINEGREMLGLPKIKNGDVYVLPYSGTTGQQPDRIQNQDRMQDLTNTNTSNKETDENN